MAWQLSLLHSILVSVANGAVLSRDLFWEGFLESSARRLVDGSTKEF